MRTMKTMATPWADIPKATERGEFTARQVGNEENPSLRPVFWAVDYCARPCLLVEYEMEAWEPARLPSLKNVDVEDYPAQRSLALILNDCQLIDSFEALCLDVVKNLQDVSQLQMRSAAVFVLEKWSCLLMRSGKGLGPEQQKGLIAELLFLDRFALKVYDDQSAVDGWTGPDRAPRDFEYGQTLIEVKSKRNSSSHKVTISSEEQLNKNSEEDLFLVVAEINQTTADDETGFVLTEVVDQVRSDVNSPMARAKLDSKLASAGFFDEDDYKSSRWSEGIFYYYMVLDDFPRITSGSCQPGVENVEYQIDLDYCDKFKTEKQSVEECMRKNNG